MTAAEALAKAKATTSDVVEKEVAYIVAQVEELVNDPRIQNLENKRRLTFQRQFADQTLERLRADGYTIKAGNEYASHESDGVYKTHISW